MPYKFTGDTTAPIDITVLDLNGNKLARQHIDYGQYEVTGLTVASGIVFAIPEDGNIKGYGLVYFTHYGPTIPYLDTFTGVDGAIPPNWTAVANTSISNNKIAVGCLPASGQIRFNYFITGDFQVQVDWTIAYASGDGYFSGIVISSPDLANYNMQLGCGSNQTYFGGFVNSVQFEEYSSLGTKYRITRSGTTLIPEKWTGSSWVSAGSSKNMTAAFVRARVTLNTWTWANRTVWGNGDNFGINSGLLVDGD